jgi:hypothetical protein
MTTKTKKPAPPDDRAYRFDLTVVRDTVWLSIECPDKSTDLIMPGYDRDPIFGPSETLGDRIEAGTAQNDIIAAHASACEFCQRAIAQAEAWVEANA